jgi:hypothetical protein
MGHVIFPFGTSFDPETNRTMGLAFEMAWAEVKKSGLHIVCQPHRNAREALALQIIELVSQGERDAAMLCDKALKQLGGGTTPRNPGTGPSP